MSLFTEMVLGFACLIAIEHFKGLGAAWLAGGVALGFHVMDRVLS